MTPNEAAKKFLDDAVRSTDINYSVDFEVALERLHGIAGRLFRQYLVAKSTGSPEVLEQAKAAYIEAQSREKGLRRHDHEAIRAILGE